MHLYYIYKTQLLENFVYLVRLHINYHYLQRNGSEERICHLLDRGSLKSLNL